MSSQQAATAPYQVAYVYRKGGGNFAGQIIISTVKINAPFSDANSGGVPPGAAFQQNVNCLNHWLQVCLLQAAGAWILYIENFKRQADGTFPHDGQVVHGTTPAGQIPGTADLLPQIPASIQLQNGGYTLVFITEDNGVDTITQTAMIKDATGAVVWELAQPCVVGDSGGNWYDPPTAVAMDIADQGGATTTFSQGANFTITHDAGVTDLTFGGQYYVQKYYNPAIPNTDPTWYAYANPAPPVNCGSAENGNVWSAPQNRNAQAAIPPGREATVNGYTGTVYLRTTDTIEWDGSGLTDDEGGVAQFGVIPHGVDPAPQGAGFMVVDEQVVDDGAMVRGSIAYDGELKAMLPDTRVLPMLEDLELDAYVYDNAPHPEMHVGYSQPVRLIISNALVFVASVYQA